MQFYNPWTAYVDPAINLLPPALVMLEYFMNAIYLKLDYMWYPSAVCGGFLFLNLVYTVGSGNNYISVFTWEDP